MDTVSDPCRLIKRNQEELITWTDNSKIKKKIFEYRNELDDYDLID